jgi:hypothetical protein
MKGKRYTHTITAIHNEDAFFEDNLIGKRCNYDPCRVHDSHTVDGYLAGSIWVEGFHHTNPLYFCAIKTKKIKSKKEGGD